MVRSEAATSQHNDKIGSIPVTSSLCLDGKHLSMMHTATGTVVPDEEHGETFISSLKDSPDPWTEPKDIIHGQQQCPPGDARLDG
jgi:hypothetical protein